MADGFITVGALKKLLEQFSDDDRLTIGEIPGMFNVASMELIGDLVPGRRVKRVYKGQLDLRTEQIMPPEWVVEEDTEIE